MLTIGWDREMDPPLEFERIPTTKVAIKDYSSFTPSEIQKRLEFKWFAQNHDAPKKNVDDNQLEAFRLALIDALEVRIEPKDPEAELEPVDFTWDIVSYSEHFIQIQLDIRNPEVIQENFGESSLLSVSFWGTKYFKSSQGKEVQYGSSVETNILRQLNPTDAEFLDKVLIYIRAFIIAIVLASTAFFSLGSLLPLWIFVNSLQIITHSTLLNSMMPGNVHYVFKEYLDLVRLNWPALNNALFDRWTYRLHGYQQGLYNDFLEASDYVHLFAQNLVIISATGLTILISWLLLAYKDYLGMKPRYQHHKFRKFFRKKHAPSANNFALRFFYEFFLEFCLAMLINIAIQDFTTFTSSVQWITSLLVAIGIAAYLCWLISLFFKNGPFLEGFYTKGTFLQSFWSARQFDTNFKAQIKLVEQIKQEKLQRLREKKQEKKEQKLELQNATLKITPINLENDLFTDRPLLNKGFAIQFDDNEPSSTLKRGLDLKYAGSSVGGQGQHNDGYAEYTNTIMSTHANNIRTNRSQIMSQINELSSEMNYSGRKLQGHPCFNDYIYEGKQGENQIGNILNFEHSASGSDKSRRGSMINVHPLDMETSVENTNYFNRETNFAPSRATQQQVQEKNRPGSMASMAETIKIDVKGNSPKTLRDSSLSRQSTQKRYLEEHSLHNPLHQIQFFGQESATLSSGMKRGSMAYFTPGFPSQGQFSRKQSSQIASPLSFKQSVLRTNDFKRSQCDQNSDQIQGGMFYEGGKAEKNNLLITPKKIQESRQQYQFSTPRRANSKRKGVPKKSPRRPQIADPKFQYFSSQKVRLDPKNLEKIQQKQKHESIIVQSAKETVAAADLIKKPLRHKTLYYGLLFNHPRNVAVVFPLLDSLRRVLYALTIVFLAHQPLFGIIFFQMGTLVMIAFGVTEWPWKDAVINQQYILNEIFTYIVSLFLLMFNGYVVTGTRLTMGYVLIGVTSVYLVYNGIIMMRKITRLSWLLLRKWRSLRRQRSLSNEAKAIANKIEMDLSEQRIRQSQKEMSSDTSNSDSEESFPPVLKVDLVPVSTGGYVAVIVRDEEKTAKLHEEMKPSEPSIDEQNIFQWQLQEIKQNEISEELKQSFDIEITKLDILEEEKTSTKDQVEESQSMQKNEILVAGSNMFFEDESTPKRRAATQQAILEKNVGLLSASEMKLMRSNSELERSNSMIKRQTLVEAERTFAVVDHLAMEKAEDEEEKKSITVTDSFTDSEKDNNQNPLMFETKRWFQPDKLDAHEQYFDPNNQKGIAILTKEHFERLTKDLINALKTQKKSELETITPKQDLNSQKDVTRQLNQTITSLQTTPLRRERILQQITSPGRSEYRLRKNTSTPRKDPQVRNEHSTPVDNEENPKIETQESVVEFHQKEDKHIRQESKSVPAQPSSRSSCIQVSNSETKLHKFTLKNVPSKIVEEDSQFQSQTSPFETRKNSRGDCIEKQQQLNEVNASKNNGEEEPKMTRNLSVRRVQKSHSLAEDLKQLYKSGNSFYKNGQKTNNSNLNLTNLLQQTPSLNQSSLQLEAQPKVPESALASSEVSKFLECKEQKDLHYRNAQNLHKRLTSRQLNFGKADSDNSNLSVGPPSGREGLPSGVYNNKLKPQSKVFNQTVQSSQKTQNDGVVGIANFGSPNTGNQESKYISPIKNEEFTQDLIKISIEAVTNQKDKKDSKTPQEIQRKQNQKEVQNNRDNEQSMGPPPSKKLSRTRTYDVISPLNKKLSRAETSDVIVFEQQKNYQQDHFLKNLDEIESDKLVVNRFNIRKNDQGRARIEDHLQFSPISDFKHADGGLSGQYQQSTNNLSKIQLNVFHEGANSTILSGIIIPQEMEEEKKYFADAGNKRNSADEIDIFNDSFHENMIKQGMAGHHSRKNVSTGPTILENGHMVRFRSMQTGVNESKGNFNNLARQSTTLVNDHRLMSPIIPPSTNSDNINLALLGMHRQQDKTLILNRSIDTDETGQLAKIGFRREQTLTEEQFSSPGGFKILRTPFAASQQALTIGKRERVGGSMPDLHINESSGFGFNQAAARFSAIGKGLNTGKGNLKGPSWGMEISPSGKPSEERTSLVRSQTQNKRESIGAAGQFILDSNPNSKRRSQQSNYENGQSASKRY